MTTPTAIVNDATAMNGVRTRMVPPGLLRRLKPARYGNDYFFCCCARAVDGGTRLFNRR